MSNAETAGPNGDGSKSLAKESKVGVLVSFVTTAAVTGAIGYLGNLDLSTLPGWLTATATAAVAALIGLGSAYVKKNAR
jgi:hypothetical protein